MKKFLLSLAVIAAGVMSVSAQQTLTICDGTATNTNVPINTLWWDNAATQSQTIYPAALISDLEGTQITSMKFYLNATGVLFSGGKCQISLGITDKDAFVNAIGITGLTVVAAEVTAPETGSTEMEIVFDAPFTYEGGNLVFECQMTEGGTYKSSSFLGESQTSNTAFSRNTTYNFLPKTTFTYTKEEVDYAAKVSPESLDFGKLNIGMDKVMNVTVKNRGTKAITPAVTLAAPYSTTYEAAALASGETVSIPVKFAPTEIGEFNSTMTIDCGEAGTFEVALSGVGADEHELTVCDDTQTNEYLPFYGFWFDGEGTYSQMIYPAEMLEGLEGATITGIKFYPQGTVACKNGSVSLSIAETDVTTYERESAIAVPSNLVTDLTAVVEALAIAGGEEVVEFTFDQPYTYNGGNLAIQTEVVTKGTYGRTYFYGSNQAGYTGWCEWRSSNAIVSFLPKMTVTYTMPSVEPQVVTVAGTVTDVENNPLEGVNVTLTVNAPSKEEPTSYTATTDAQGAYTMNVTPVEGATYNMAFAKEGYEDQTLEDVDLENVPTVVLVEDNPTAISTINAGNAVSVKYIDAMGRVSDRPFKGVNIVVTTNADGTTTTAKVVK